MWSLITVDIPGRGQDSTPREGGEGLLPHVPSIPIHVAPSLAYYMSVGIHVSGEDVPGEEKEEGEVTDYFHTAST